MYKKGMLIAALFTFITPSLLGLLPTPSEAGVFWTDDFENHLTPNWDTAACGSPAPQDGCNGAISTDMATNGTHSLKSHYGSTDNLFLHGAGTSLKRSYPATTDTWMRFYYRTTNFQYGRDVTKHFILRGVYWLNIWGSREMAANVVTGSTPVTCSNGNLDVSCNYYPNRASVPLEDNKWYCIETHVRASSPQFTLNGRIEIYVDGVQTLDYQNIATYDTSTQQNTVDHYTQYGFGERYIDNLAVGDTRIGCTGNPLSNDVTPPTSPTGLTAR